MAPFDTDAPSTPPPPALSAAGADGDALIDGFARRIDYVRVSVTDRCDLRCTYCMPQRMRFLPRAEVLGLDELDRLCTALIGMGVRTLRLTGGEPLVRKDVMSLVRAVSRHLATGALRELTLTTNGTRLADHAAALADCGVRRINVSLDTLDADIYRRLTRGGDVAAVMRGLDAAQAAGLRVKINTVVLRRDNLSEIAALIAWAHGRGFDLTLIETMPMGEVDQDRGDQYVPLSEVRDTLAAIWTLALEAYATGGPARYMRVAETGGRIGLITPMSHNFCDSCNRVRVSCTGMLHTCLGDDGAVDLRTPLRAHPLDDGPLRAAVRAALAAKPRRHAFAITPGAGPSVSRHMSVTGG